MKLCDKVLKHLKDDSKTWLKLEKEAKREREADLREIREIKKHKLH